MIFIKASSRDMVECLLHHKHFWPKEEGTEDFARHKDRRVNTNQHKFYCGIDPDARSMCIGILDQKGKTVLRRNYKASPEAFLRPVKPYRRDIAVGVGYAFVWYWRAHVCAQEKITFV